MTKEANIAAGTDQAKQDSRLTPTNGRMMIITAIHGQKQITAIAPIMAIVTRFLVLFNIDIPFQKMSISIFKVLEQPSPFYPPSVSYPYLFVNRLEMALNKA